MSRPKLTYFDFPGGRGEDCRIALFIAGVDFEDDRVKGPQWREIKAATPFGKLPTMSLPGRDTLFGSNAILGMIGRMHGLLPADPWEAARHEGLMDAVEAGRALFENTFSLGDEEKQAAREAIVAGKLADWLAGAEKQLRGPWVGDEFGVADLKLFIFLRWFRSGALDHVPTDVFDAYPKLATHYAAVESHPGVLAWYAR